MRPQQKGLRRLFALTLVACACVAAGCQTATPRAGELRPLVTDVGIPSRGVIVPATWVVPDPELVRNAMPLAILIHGHGGTRHEAGGFTRLAEQLAAIGIASIRMDFPGSGDSTEPWPQNNLGNMLADVRAARLFAAQHADIDLSRIGLVGFSMGGRLAAMLSQSDGNIDSMVLWAPAVENGADEMVEMLGGPESYAAMRATAAEQGYAPFTTFWGQQQQLGLKWFEDMETSRPMDALRDYRGALMLIHGSNDDVVPPAVSRMAAEAAGKARPVKLHIIDGADHGFGLFSDPDLYSAELIDETVAFLRREL